MTLASDIILAVLLDHWLGEPKKHHPLVAFGRLTDWVEVRLRNPGHSRQRQKHAGILALLILLFPATAIAFLLQQLPVVDLLLPPAILYFCIAASSLKQHADRVLQHLQANDLPAARQAVAYLVSRESDRMNAEQVRRATIESVLENGADAVFAPLFWFVVAGPVGALLYRLGNTLDAMWGYKNPRYLYFGWAAARLDDLLNWLPARLTALSYALLGKTRLAWSCWRKQAIGLESPNAGPVMTAGAGALDIRLGGPAFYHGRSKNKIFFGSERPAKNRDIEKANHLIDKTLWLWVGAIVIGDILA